MNILSLDTSTDVLSIALKCDKSYEERLVWGNFSHSEDLLNEILSLLGRADLTLKDLDLLIASKGPGSFTGLRVGIASLKGIRAGSDAKLVTIPTLEAMAYALKGLSEHPVLPCIDARKGRFYFALYDSNGNELAEVKDSDVDRVEEDIQAYEKVIITGKDADLFLSKLTKEEVRNKFIIDRSCPRNISSALIELGLKKFEKDGEDDIGEGPLYVRRSDAEEALLKKVENENA